MEFRHVPPYDLLMAAQTQVLPCCYQEFFSIAGMGEWQEAHPFSVFMGACTTFAFSTFSATFGGTGHRASPFRREQFLVGSAVRIMAGGTSAQQGRMDALPLHHSLHIKMAGEAQLAALLEQQPLVLRLMGRVAVGAIPAETGPWRYLKFTLSGWQVRQRSLRGWSSSLGSFDECGLWHDVHIPSLTGGCTLDLVPNGGWHMAQSAGAVA